MNPAKQSPRIEQDNSIRWYAGDTFTITLNFVLKDSSGNPITPVATDRIDVLFKNESQTTIKSFSNTGSSSINLVFDTTTTALFSEGIYRIEAKWNSSNVTTLLHNNLVVVE